MNQLLHAFCTITAHTLCQVTIGIQGECRRMVSKVFFHSQNIVTVLQGERGERMSERMEITIIHANAGEYLFEMLIYGPAVERSPEVIRENQIEFVLP